MKRVLTTRLFSAIVWILIAATLGFASIAVPGWLLQGGVPETDTAPLFPAIGSAIENMALMPTVVTLFAVGTVLGFLQHQIWWLLGVSMVAVFPVCTVIEIAFFPESHNLWPLEFAMLGLINVPAFLGALVGSKVKERIRNSAGRTGRANSNYS